jgi:hypothetical protein
VGGTHRIAERMDRSPQGQSFKWHAVYPEPFWGQGSEARLTPFLH